MSAKILIAVVLYECHPCYSKTMNTLMPIVSQFGSDIRIVTFNNSMRTVIVPDRDFEVYQADSNRGLAEPYNLALTICLQDNIPFLITMDQDTALNAQYLQAMIEKASNPSEKIGAYVPLITNENNHLSPGYYNVEKGLYGSHLPLKSNEEISNLTADSVPYAFNSATMWSVEALKDCGGFPQRYVLDMLDHAMFRKLYFKDWGMEIVNPSHYLTHGLSLESKDGMTEGRAKSYLNFVRLYYIEEEMLQEYYQKHIKNPSLRISQANFMKVMLKQGLKRFVMGLMGKKKGFPTLEMYLSELNKLKKSDEMHTFVPFSKEYFDSESEYTSYKKLAMI